MSRGIQRERDLRKRLEAEGWWTMRAAASKGEVDIIAMKAGFQPRFIEVKSTVGGPFEHFRPADRAGLLEAAGHAGAAPELAYWPPRGELRFIPPSGWPNTAP